MEAAHQKAEACFPGSCRAGVCHRSNHGATEEDCTGLQRSAPGSKHQGEGISYQSYRRLHCPERCATEAPVQGPTASQRRWHEQAGVQPPACYRCPPSPGSSPPAKLSTSTKTRLGTAPAATGRNQATPCSQTFAVGTCATRFCPLFTTLLVRLLEHSSVPENNRTATA